MTEQEKFNEDMNTLLSSLTLTRAIYDGFGKSIKSLILPEWIGKASAEVYALMRKEATQK